MENPLLQAQALGQSTWHDNIRRGLLTSGELAELIRLGITGLTSNPTIFEKAIAGSTDYDSALLELARAGVSPAQAFENLALEDIRDAADVLRSVYDHTNGDDGYASLEVPPSLAYDTEATVAEARRLHAALDRPNVMVKVPATPEGVPAVRQLIADGININVTLVFSLELYSRVMEAYLKGLEELIAQGKDPRKVASVASFFVSRVDTAVDGALQERIRAGESDLAPLLGKAAIANARVAYALFRQTFDQERFAALRAKGARVQRPLWASTSTKDPAYPDTLYVDSLVGPDTVNTMPPATITAVLDHGKPAPSLEGAAEEAQATLDALAQAGIDMKAVTAKLLDDGVRAFAQSFDAVVESIKEKQARLLAEQSPPATLGAYADAATETMEALQRDQVITRIWRKDHTVWKPDPREITNRLGWLTVTDIIRDQLPALESFAQEVKEAGFRHVVLLGMGGSSLCSEVLRQILGSAPGYPELLVLDSTVPARVQEVTDAVDPDHTLFIVSSKSGGTAEVLSFYHHFRAQVESAVGGDRAGGHFVAITDPGSSLEELARGGKFRRTFLNPADVGGRFSALTYFHMVPAALMGIDVAQLLDRADCIREGCATCVPCAENASAWLGAVMGTLAKQGVDKLTLVTSPALASFGLWVEQLIAESLGKDGTGVVPVAGEPLMDPSAYGRDRLFVHLRLAGDDNVATDAHLEALREAGHPALCLDMRDRYDLGAEFFRWEFAMAVAGAVLGVHPFDQPNVQEAKEFTGALLQAASSGGQAAHSGGQAAHSGGQSSGRDGGPAAAEVSDGSLPAGSLKDLLRQARPGDYLAVLAYVNQSPAVDEALYELRRTVVERYGIATTAGYGPRYLHSTGQLHKAGPPTGLYLQLTADEPPELPIPGQSHTFRELADAQALGDLQALRSRGRRVARHHLGADPAAALRTLTGSLQ